MSLKMSFSSKTLKILFVAIIILILIAIAFSDFIFNNKKSINAENGVLDLSGWSIDDDGTVALSGDWAFYWNRFATNEGMMEPNVYARVPDVWNNYKIGNSNLPAYGYATYSLLVKGVGNEPISIRMLPCSTAYALYINSDLLAQNGAVSNTDKESIPEYEPEIVTFQPTDGQFTITLFVSNYIYARGGFWYAPILGTPSQIRNIDRSVNYLDLILLGSFITISLFCFCFYAFARRDISIILFALLALVTALRASIYGSYLLSSTGLPFRLLIIIEYLTLIWIPALISLFLLSLAKNGKKFRFVVIAIAYFSAIFTLFIFISPVHVFTRYTIPIEMLCLAISLYSLIVLLKSSFHAKVIIALGSLALILCGIHDVLLQNCFIRGYVELSPIGFFIMLNTWGIVLAKDYTHLNKFAIATSEKAQTAEIAFLQAQIKPHFLYNALNVIATLCRLDNVYAEELTLDLSKYLHYTFEFKNLSKFINFSSELEFVETYIKIEKARFVDEFEVVYDLCDTSDLMVPPFSIQPLIENAIRHGIRKKEQFGTVLLRVRKEKDSFIIEVQDDGVGIEPEMLEMLRKGIFGKSEGVGLINVKQRIERIYKTEFLITSEVGIGTKITLTIPIN